MHRTGWLLCLALLPLAIGCAAGAGGAKDGDPRIANALVRIFETADPRTAAEERGLDTSAHGVRVDVQTQGLEAGDRERFDRPGVHVHHFSPRAERVAVSVRDHAALRALARIEPVRRLAPAYGTADDGATGGAY